MIKFVIFYEYRKLFSANKSTVSVSIPYACGVYGFDELVE